MTVKELIDKLKQFDENSEVRLALELPWNDNPPSVRDRIGGVLEESGQVWVVNFGAAEEFEEFGHL